MTSARVSRRTNTLVWVCLLALLLLTWATARINMGPLNAIVAMTIAAVKTAVVMLFYMHLRYSNRVTWLFASLGFFWFAILVLLALADYFTRQ